MGDAQKKVVVRKFSGELVWGYLPQTGFVNGGVVEMLTVESRVIWLVMSEIRWIATVRDWNLEDSLAADQVGRRSFLGRPRGHGLWLRVTFVDGQFQEGLAHFDTGFLDGMMQDGGIRMTVPEARSNTQSLFIPRSAIEGVVALGAVLAPAKRKARREEAGNQSSLFG